MNRYISAVLFAVLLSFNPNAFANGNDRGHSNGGHDECHGRSHHCNPHGGGNPIPDKMPHRQILIIDNDSDLKTVANYILLTGTLYCIYTKARYDYFCHDGKSTNSSDERSEDLSGTPNLTNDSGPKSIIFRQQTQ